MKGFDKMNRAIKEFVEEKGTEYFIGKTNMEVYAEYVHYVEGFGLNPIGFKSFAKMFGSISGLTTKQKYARGGNVRVYDLKNEDGYEKGFKEYIAEKNAEMFEDEENTVIYKDYCKQCIDEGHSILGLCEFSRRLCLTFDMKTKSVRHEGENVRVFRCEQ